MALAVGLLGSTVFVQAPAALAQSDLQFSAAVTDQTCTLVSGQSHTDCEWTLPEATGGTGNKMYWIVLKSSSSAANFLFDRDTRKLSVSGSQSIQTRNGWPFEYLVTDRAGSITADFRVKIDGSPIAHFPANLQLKVNEAIPTELQRFVVNGNGVLKVTPTVKGWNAPADDRAGGVEFDSVPGLTFGVDNERATDTPQNAHVTLSGKPTQPGEYEVTLKLTDGDGDESSSTFTIFVNAAPSFGGAQVPNTVFAIGEEGEITLPEFTPGNGKVSDHLLTLGYTAPWPSWLFDDTANPASAKLIGTPPVGSDMDAKIVTVTVKDYKLNDHFGQDSDTIELCFSVGDGDPCEVDFGDATVPSQVYPVNAPITALTLPEVLRATGTVAYSVSSVPPLPDGLVFRSDSRTLSGTPTQIGSFAVIYTATDEADASASLTFDIEVDGAPSFADTRIANTVFTISEEGEITLPELTLGNGTWAEHTRPWNPALPSWLTFDDADPAALQLHGTAPASNAAGQTYVLTVTDSPVTGQSSGDFVTLSLCFSVGDGDPCPGVDFVGVTVAPQTYTKGRRIAPLTLPEARLGTGALTYRVSGLPDGLMFDPGTRRLSGTPGEGGDFTATYTVTDATDTAASLEFDIRVDEPLSFGGAAPSGFDFTEDLAITTIPLPASRGGVGERNYSVSGLPAGLRFDTSGSAPTLSGTPTSAGTFKLVLKATDSNGASASLSIPIRVHLPVSFRTPFVTLGFPGPDNTLPAAQGGFGELSYSLACTTASSADCEGDPSLPPGITFDAETRTVSGSFTERGGYRLELTATDRNGAMGTLNLDLRVAGIVVEAYANKADQDARNPITDSTIRVPEVSDSIHQDDAPRYTLKLAVTPAEGEEVEIFLSGPSGDNNLQYYQGEGQQQKFTYAGNNYGQSQTIVLIATDDLDGENGKATIRHRVESDDPSYDGFTFDVTLEEVDDDPSVQLSLDPASYGEDAGETSVTVTARVTAPAGNPGLTSLTEATTVALRRAGGTATSPADYTVEVPSPFAITIPANQSEATVTFKLTPKPDELYEVPDETIVWAGTTTGTSTGRRWSTWSATFTIMDNDTPSLVADCGSRAVREGGGGQTMHVICTVTLRDANGNPVTAAQDTTFRYRTVAGSATPGEDYEDKEDEVIIPAGQSSASFAVAVYDDDEQEASEQFTVEFFASPPFDEIPVTIYDDDRPAPPPATDEEDEEEVSGPDDAYRATVAFGATAYTATEGGQAATITVRLHPAPPASRSVSIPVAGRGGQGVTPDDWRILVDTDAGDTWDGATGTASVVFAPGETERTFALEAVDDNDFEGNETLTLTFDAARLPEGVTADPEAAEAMVTLVDDDFQAYRGRVLKQVLAAFGRTVASDAVTLLTGRMEDDAPATGSRASLAGQTLRLDGASLGTTTLAEAGPAERGVAVLADAVEPWHTSSADPRTRAFTARELLTGSSFRYRLGAAEGDGLGLVGGAWTLWGEGGTASFAGRPETDFSLDGEAASGWLGVDWRREPAVVGISLSHYRGDVGYETGVADGDVKLDLTSVFPYARWSLAEMDLWGVAGLGAGRLELADSFGGNQSDMTMQMAAAGARRTMRPAGERGISLAAKADAFAVRLASEARGLGTQAVGDDLPAVNARAGRLRVGLEAGYVHKLASGAVLRPTVDLGARLDSGDADSGAGIDLSGGVRYESPSGRLTLEGRGRMLLAHAATGFQEWAAGGLVRLAPEAGGRGLSLSVAPSWGMATSRTGALWDGDLPGAQGEAGARVTTEIGYGLPAFKGLGLLTPWAGTELAQDRERAWRAGMRLELHSDLALKLQGSRRENRDGEREQEIGMRLSIGF